MSFINTVDWFKKQDPLSVPLKGVVVSNTDPKKLGRIKVTIDGLLTSGNTAALPWVYPKNPAGQGGSPDASGFDAPDVGSELIIEFPHRDIYFGFYTGYWQSGDTHQGLFTEDYPSSYGTRDTQNTYWKVNKAKKTATFNHVSRAYVQWDGAGGVTNQTPGQHVFISEDQQSFVTLDQLNGTYTISPVNELDLITQLMSVEVDDFEMQAGTYNENVDGPKTANVSGNFLDSVGGDRSNSVTGNFQEAIFGGETRIVALVTDETFGLGKKETVVEGDHEVEVMIGNINYKTLAGNVNIGNPLATYEQTIAGAINQSSTLDTTLKALLNFNIQATLNAMIQGGPEIMLSADGQATLKAAMTLLNSGSGPVLTQETDPLIDLITGAPTMGVPTVLAGP